MSKLILKAMNVVGATGLVLVVAILAVAAAPFVLAWKAYRLIELKAVYGGDGAARDRAEYKMGF